MPTPKDYLVECNDQGLRQDEFTTLFCQRCKNPECARAKWADSLFAQRVSTQEARLFNPSVADPRLPKYARFAQQEFTDMLAQATRLEIASRRGDWEIPEIPILDGRVEVAAKNTTEMVEHAVKALGGKQPPIPSSRVVESLAVDHSQSDPCAKESEENPPAVIPQRSGVASPRPPAGPISPPKLPNIPVPEGGIMVDGSVPAASAALPPPEPVDPWAVPEDLKARAKKVEIGAKIAMRGTKLKGGQ